MEPKDIEFWSRAMKLTSKIVANIRKSRVFEKNEILAMCLAFRIVNSSQAIRSLLDQKLIHDAKAVLRTQSEALILLAGSLYQKDFMDSYHGEGLDRRKRIFKKMRRGGIWKDEDLSLEQIEARNTIEAELKKYKGIDIEKLANEHDLKFEYFHLHNNCSSEIHHLPSTMQEYIEVDFPNKHIEFIEFPEIGESQLIICAAYGNVLRVGDFLNDHFKLGMEPSIKSLSEEGAAWFDKGEEPVEAVS